MKVKFLLAGLLGMVSVTAFAQKSALNDAQTNYDTYMGVRSQPALAKPKLADAKTAIDKAAANDKTSALPQTYALKGAIYIELALADTARATSAPFYQTATESLKKATELDTKGENKKIIDQANLGIAQYSLNVGAKDYQAGKFDQAYAEFDQYRTVLPTDTNAIYYTALAAANAAHVQHQAKFYPLAIQNYKTLVTTKYSKGNEIYAQIAQLNLDNKDTTAAIAAASEGATKFPNDSYLGKLQIELALQTGKAAEAVTKIDAQIAADPKNKTLYYYKGLTYSQIAEGYAPEIKKTKDAAAKAALQQKRNDAYAKSAEAYKQAVAIDPSYFEANLNLGYVIMMPAIDAYNAAQQLPTTKQKEYDAIIAKTTVQFDAAKPYLVKSTELQANSIDAWQNLNMYYRAKRDNANIAATQKKIDDLNAKH